MTLLRSESGMEVHVSLLNVVLRDVRPIDAPDATVFEKTV